MKRGKTNRFFLLFLWMLCPLLPAVKPDLIKNPQPTDVEKMFSRLQRVAAVPATFGRNEFLGIPAAIQGDERGTLFVLDSAQARVFQFDAGLRYIRSFGQKGLGPADIGAAKNAHTAFCWGLDGRLYIGDLKKPGLISYDAQGNSSGELKLKNPEYKGLLPYMAVDRGSRIYVPSIGDSALIDRLDPEGSRNASYLAPEDFHHYLFVSPGALFFKSKSIIPTNMSLDLLPDSTLLVYFHHNSRLFILQKGRVTRQVNLWPKEALENFSHVLSLMPQDKVEEDRKKNETRTTFHYVQMFVNFFTDRDDPGYFYLQVGHLYKRDATCLYRFDLKGRLQNVMLVDMKTEGRPKFRWKKNGLFYAIADGNVISYKEVP